MKEIYANIETKAKGFHYTFTFAVGSVNSGSLTAHAKGTISGFSNSNVATWSITKNGLLVASNSAPTPFAVSEGDGISLSITRTNPALASTFLLNCPAFDQDNRTINILDFSNIGGDSRYLYVLSKSANNLTCIDNNLLALSNLKAITAVVNNGASLTLTCAGHGFINGNVISLIDVGGFASDINHKPWAISNVTTNTFDITTTVTGAWDTNGRLAGAWITNPILATIALPTNSGAWSWGSLTHRHTDKTLYIFGDETAGARRPIVCTVDADDTSIGFNTVKNWDKTVSNSATIFGSTNRMASLGVTTIYDPINDRFFICSLADTYYIPFGGSTPVPVKSSGLTSSGTLFSTADCFFAYTSACAIYGLGVVRLSHAPTLNGYYSATGITLGRSIYSFKQGKFYIKTNAPGVNRYTADGSLSLEASVSGSMGHTWNSTGCAVDSLDKLYMFRWNSGSFSYPGTFDLMIWDSNLNTIASKEDTHIACPSSGSTFILKAVYSHFSGKVLAVDNGTPNGRLHIFDPTRAAGKKYIGYVNLSGVTTDCLMNNLAWL